MRRALLAAAVVLLSSVACGSDGEPNDETPIEGFDYFNGGYSFRVETPDGPMRCVGRHGSPGYSCSFVPLAAP